jgi:ferric-dicitrate binding protein FerR (iron transport regulator)
MRFQKPILALVTLAALAAVSDAQAQDPSGAAEKVSQAASATGAIGERMLEVQGPVYMGDQLRTNSAGEAQIRFADDTRLVVGPSARVTIDRFVYSGGSARQVTLSAVRGAFRFISGNSPSQAYSLRTPVLTIGVRGTGLDGFVEAGTGRTVVAIYDGAAEVCNAAAQCVVISEACQIVVVDPGGGFGDLPPASRGLFLPYSISQGSLLADFSLDTSACQGGSPAFRNPTDSGGAGDRASPGLGSDSGDGDSDGGSQF